MSPLDPLRTFCRVKKIELTELASQASASILPLRNVCFWRDVDGY
jgi:hypothetical protein